ncbi:MAG: hypothetical protein J0I12_05980 [Candidatus Eremiobacteraeota bacterium]|nr:hypothetical protein [Candidatus Eremiobacteraeota bacterium]
MRRRSHFLWLALILPLWWTVGRALLGSIGWGTFALVLFFPVLLAPLGITLLYALRGDVRRSGRLRPDEAGALWAMYASLFAGGFFFVDAGDSSPSMGSVFTHLVHGGESFSSAAAGLMLTLGLLLGGLCLVGGCFRLGSAYRKKSPGAPGSF